MTGAAQVDAAASTTAADVEQDFAEGFVAADGFRIRYRAAGRGVPLIHFPGGHGLVLTPGHALLSGAYRVIVFEMPGFGDSPENTRTATIEELARTMLAAVAALGVDRFHLMGTSFGAKVACWAALQAPERVISLVLEAPGAIRPEDWTFPSDPAAGAEAADSQGAAMASRQQMRQLARRLLGPNRDEPFEDRLRGLTTPTLVLFGTDDVTIDAAAVGHIYKELLASCSLVYVYGAGHSISSQRPAAFADVVADYLERHQTFVVSRRPTLIFP
jgi:pimeloyl-ACP methyl ester carboxylesterase